MAKGSVPEGEGVGLQGKAGWCWREDVMRARRNYSGTVDTERKVKDEKGDEKLNKKEICIKRKQDKREKGMGKTK